MRMGETFYIFSTLKQEHFFYVLGISKLFHNKQQADSL